MKSGELNADPLVGTKIHDRYLIDSVIGIGGWSNVYSAMDLNLKRAVAVKVMHRHLLTDEETVKRFLREAEAAGCINHPHVVTVYDSGLMPEGRPYIVMEMVNARPLSELLKSNERLPVKRFIDIFLQLCEGLQAAHQNGIIHRDLKPSNILIASTEQGGDFIKVVDFGLAKILPGARSTEELTAAGTSIGTPGYMSPEQCRGNELDARSDLYSLGCIMYRALTGLKPIEEENIYLCLSKQILEMPRPFQQARPDLYIPERLEEVIFKCLAKEPSCRFAGMKELHEALAACRTGTAAQNTEHRRAPAPLLRAILLGLALLAVSFVFVTHAPPPQPQKASPPRIAAAPAIRTDAIKSESQSGLQTNGGKSLVEQPTTTSAPPGLKLKADKTASTKTGAKAPEKPEAPVLRADTARSAKPLPQPSDNKHVAVAEAPNAKVEQTPVSLRQTQTASLTPRTDLVAEWLHRKSRMLQTEATLDPVMRLVGLQPEPIPSGDYVPDPDLYAQLEMQAKLAAVQSAGPRWSAQSGHGDRLQRIIAQMQAIDGQRLSPDDETEARTRVLDQALAMMEINPPMIPADNVPKLFFSEALQKRLHHKTARIQLALPEWAARGGEPRQIEVMLKDFVSRMDAASR